MHACRIALHPFPVPLERKQHTVGDAHGAEDAPAVQESNLAGAQALLVCIQNIVIVQQEAVHILILSRWGELTGCARDRRALWPACRHVELLGQLDYAFHFVIPSLGLRPGSMNKASRCYLIATVSKCQEPTSGDAPGQGRRMILG